MNYFKCCSIKQKQLNNRKKSNQDTVYKIGSKKN